MGVEVKVIGGVARLTGRIGCKAPGVLTQLNDCIKPAPQRSSRKK